MITLILGVLLILLFFAAVYVGAGAWRGLHITAVIFTFLAAVGFLVLASMSLKTRAAWLAAYDQLSRELADEQQTYEQLLHGDLTEVVQKTPSLQSLKAAFRRAVVDRGRVWRGCARGDVQANQATGEVRITLTTAPPGAPPESVKPNGIIKDSVLFAFWEQDSPEGFKAPAVFLGEYQAVDATDTTVTLTPTVPLDVDLARKVRSATGTWALYEAMPRDSHTIFAVEPPDEQHLFGVMDPQNPPFQMVSEAQLRKVFPNQIRTPAGETKQWLPEDQYEQLIQRMVQSQQRLAEQYARDGQRARETDPREHVWVKVRFLKRYEVDVDTPRAAPSGEQIVTLPLNTDYFDPNGRALLDGLRRGKTGPPEPAVFEPNDVGLLIRDEAERLIGQGVCEMIEPIYVRPLTDYQFAYHENFRLSMQLSEYLRGVQNDTATIQDAIARCEHEISLRQKDKQLLGEDLAKLRQEGSAVREYADAVAAAYDGAMGELSRLYRTNLALAEELAAAQAALAEQIDRRTAEAVGAPDG